MSLRVGMRVSIAKLAHSRGWAQKTMTSTAIRVAVLTPCVVTKILESGKVRVDLGDGVSKLVCAGQLVYSEGTSA